jgi:hypothetical protein
MLENYLHKAQETIPSIDRIRDENDSGVFGTQVRARTT